LPAYETISYEGAKINGLFQELEFETVQLIASAYKQITSNKEFGNSLLTRFLQTSSETRVLDIVGSVDLLCTDVLTNEALLLQRLEEKIQILEEYKSTKKL